MKPGKDRSGTALFPWGRGLIKVFMQTRRGYSLFLCLKVGILSKRRFDLCLWNLFQGCVHSLVTDHSASGLSCAGDRCVYIVCALTDLTARTRGETSRFTWVLQDVSRYVWCVSVGCALLSLPVCVLHMLTDRLTQFKICFTSIIIIFLLHFFKKSVVFQTIQHTWNYSIIKHSKWCLLWLLGDV